MNNSAKDNSVSHARVNSQLPINSGEIIIGSIRKVDPSGVYVDFPHNPEEHDLLALSTLAIEATHIGREVALLFNGGDLRHPVIMGMIHSAMLDSFSAPEISQPEPSQSEASGTIAKNETDEIEVLADGKKCHITANEELKLQCGKASITMTKDGKIFLRGTYLSSRSSGTNRVLGGSVLLN